MFVEVSEMDHLVLFETVVRSFTKDKEKHKTYLCRRKLERF